jgi:hypothetical protein
LSNEVFMHHATRFAHAAALAAGLALHCACAGEPAPVQAQAADPQAAVPATVYQSAITYRPAAEPATPPDRNWVAGNATVAAYNAMSLTMKMRGMHAHGAAAPAAPAVSAKPVQTADPHAGHGGTAPAPVAKEAP